MSETYSVVGLCHVLFGQLMGLWVAFTWTVMTEAVVNVRVPVFVWPVFDTVRYIP